MKWSRLHKPSNGQTLMDHFSAEGLVNHRTWREDLRSLFIAYILPLDHELTLSMKTEDCDLGVFVFGPYFF